MSNIVKTFAITTLLLLMVGCGGTQTTKTDATDNIAPYTQVKEQMREYIKKQMDRQNLVGISVALVDDQTIVWQEGFGYADKKNGIKATPQTRYHVASITKVFNAMAVMKLQEEGIMDIDKPLKIYLPSFSIKSRFGSTDGITPRTLMSHHSGIIGDWYDKMYADNPYNYTEYADLIKDEYVAYAPNTVLAYSNVGITLLGDAIEQSAGQNYTEFMEENLLKPMEMNNSYIKTVLEGDCKSYREAEEVKDYPTGMIPDGGLNSSVSDLSHLAMMINADGKYNGKTILNPKSLKEMQSVQNADVALDFGDKVGLGLFIEDNILSGRDRIYHHGGDTGTHHSFFAVTKNSKLGVVVMSNSDETPSESIAIELLTKAYEAKSGIKLEHNNTLAKLEKHLDIEGTYASSEGKITFEKKGDGFYTMALMGKTISLKLGEDNRYHNRNMMFGEEQMALYTEEINGKTYLIDENSWKKSAIGVKVEQKPISTVWQERLGEYHIINQMEPEEMQIKKVVTKIEDGYFMFNVEMKSGDKVSFLLELVNDDEAIIEGVGRSMRETIRMVDEEFHYSGLRFR